MRVHDNCDSLIFFSNSCIFLSVGLLSHLQNTTVDDSGGGAGVDGAGGRCCGCNGTGTGSGDDEAGSLSDS